MSAFIISNHQNKKNENKQESVGDVLMRRYKKGIDVLINPLKINKQIPNENLFDVQADQKVKNERQELFSETKIGN